jgi:hypothetical protein
MYKNLALFCRRHTWLAAKRMRNPENIKLVNWTASVLLFFIR